MHEISHAQKINSKKREKSQKKKNLFVIQLSSFLCIYFMNDCAYLCQISSFIIIILMRVVYSFHVYIFRDIIAFSSSYIFLGFLFLFDFVSNFFWGNFFVYSHFFNFYFFGNGREVFSFFRFFWMIFFNALYLFVFFFPFAVVLLDTTKEATLEWTRYPYGPQAQTPGVSF